MLYDPSMQREMVAALKQKEVSIVENIVRALKTGYPASQNNYIYKLAWNGMLLDAYENIFVFNKDDQDHLESLYYKVISLL